MNDSLKGTAKKISKNKYVRGAAEQVVTGAAVKLGTRILGGPAGIAINVAASAGPLAKKVFFGIRDINKELKALYEEKSYWSSAISCIGRNPYTPGTVCSLDEGGAICALARKHRITLDTRYGSRGVEADIIITDSMGGDEEYYFPPDPKRAKGLVSGAVAYLKEATCTTVQIEQFDKKRNAIVKRLEGLESILETKTNPREDYSNIQGMLLYEVERMISIETVYQSKITGLESKKQSMINRYLLTGATTAVIALVWPFKLKKK